MKYLNTKRITIPNMRLLAWTTQSSDTFRSCPMSWPVLVLVVFYWSILYYTSSFPMSISSSASWKASDALSWRKWRDILSGPGDGLWLVSVGIEYFCQRETSVLCTRTTYFLSPLWLAKQVWLCRAISSAFHGTFCEETSSWKWYFLYVRQETKIALFTDLRLNILGINESVQLTN